MEQAGSRPYHQLEYIVHMHFLDKYLPKKGLILDAGCGPGRYTLELAKKGYEVILLDLSAKSLEIAKREIARAQSLAQNPIVVLQRSVSFGVGRTRALRWQKAALAPNDFN